MTAGFMVRFIQCVDLFCPLIDLLWRVIPVLFFDRGPQLVVAMIGHAVSGLFVSLSQAAVTVRFLKLHDELGLGSSFIFDFHLHMLPKFRTVRFREKLEHSVRVLRDGRDRRALIKNGRLVSKGAPMNLSADGIGNLRFNVIECGLVSRVPLKTLVMRVSARSRPPAASDRLNDSQKAAKKLLTRGVMFQACPKTETATPGAAKELMLHLADKGLGAPLTAADVNDRQGLEIISERQVEDLLGGLVRDDFDLQLSSVKSRPGIRSPVHSYPNGYAFRLNGSLQTPVCVDIV
jgi:hypothetical protein